MPLFLFFAFAWYQTLWVAAVVVSLSLQPSLQPSLPCPGSLPSTEQNLARQSTRNSFQASKANLASDRVRRLNRVHLVAVLERSLAQSVHNPEARPRAPRSGCILVTFSLFFWPAMSVATKFNLTCPSCVVFASPVAHITSPSRPTWVALQLATVNSNLIKAAFASKTPITLPLEVIS